MCMVEPRGCAGAFDGVFSCLMQVQHLHQALRQGLMGELQAVFGKGTRLVWQGQPQMREGVT